LQTSVLDFWGKARPVAGDGPGSHPLAWHQLDVAASLEALLALPVFAAAVPASCHRLLIFLAALHDTGKFSRSFQSIAPEHWPALLGVCTRIAAPRHDTLGWMMLSRPLWTNISAHLDGWEPEHLEPLLRAVTGHHGRPPEELEGRIPRDWVCRLCEETAGNWINLAADLLEPNPPAPPDELEVQRLSWLVAGLVNLADWIGSDQRFFTYEQPSYSPVKYLDLARERAAQAIAASGLQLAPVAPDGGMTALFPGLTPSPMQAWAQTVPLAPGPLLAIIEDTTGSGKTEAALILAHRLMAAGRAHGLFFALPTMATADAMFARLGASYRRMYSPASRPSLVLAHGQARLHEGFRDSILEDAGTSDEVGEEEAEPAGPSCAAWIADDRRKAFLAEIGAGTVDQALLAALPIRHAALRLLGLSRRVLIVDEVHAYDPYMRAELCGLLRFQAALGGSAILLSATLPQAMKRDLAEAFQCGGRASLVALAYPLATLVGAGRMTEHAVAVRAEAVRRLPVRRLETVEQAAEAVRAASVIACATCTAASRLKSGLSASIRPNIAISAAVSVRRNRSSDLIGAASPPAMRSTSV
jgi:CRISPR-associated endonuclease/helicase Cas3